MKKIFSFTINKLIEVEKTEEKDDGSKVITKVKENTPIPFCILKPTRIMIDDGELYYHQAYSKYLDADVKPEILLRKMYSNQNGIFTEKEKKEYVDLIIELGSNLTKIREYEEKKELDEKEKSIVGELNRRNKEIQNEIASFENVKQSIFENSAESLSRNKTAFWWLLKLLYNESDMTPVFAGETHEERANSFDEINEKIDDGVEEGKFYSNLIARASFLASLLYLNGSIKPDEFSKLVAEYDSRIKED